MADLSVMVLRLLLAAFLAGLIGLEREIRDQPAGLRTHLLTGIASCMLMLLSIYGFKPYLNDHVTIDISRIPAYVISGLGFLCGGTIIVNRGNVKGLTTAAGIWTVAGIGLVVGAGMYELAMIVTVLVMASLSVLKRIVEKLDETKEG